MIVMPSIQQQHQRHHQKWPENHPRLLVVGSFVYAHCWRVPHLPKVDETQQALKYIQECAGKGLAVALGSHRLGVPVDLVMAIGQDQAGDELLQLLQQQGMETSYIHRLGHYSGQGCGLIDCQGKATITIFDGANALLTAQHTVLSDANLSQVAYLYAQLEVPQPTVAQTFSNAKERGIVNILNPSPWQPLADETMAATDVLIVNQCEVVQLFNQLLRMQLPIPDISMNGCAAEITKVLKAMPANVLQNLWALWPAGQWLIVTLAEMGCIAWSSDGQCLYLMAHPVQAVQPIGAGDAFSAGLCAALVQGQSFQQALTVANACGALAASRPGILAALPSHAEVQSLLIPAI